MVNQRRHFLQQCLLSTLSFISSLCFSHASYSKENALSYASNLDALLARLFPDQLLVNSEEIQVNLPEIAEDGSVVPIGINSALESIEKITIVVENNPIPLTAEFFLEKTVNVKLSTRIKMAESSFVVVIAQNGERFLRKQQWVNVVRGGCGTG